MGTLYADGVFVVISPVLHKDQALHILKDCNVKILITQSNKLKIISDELHSTEVKKVILNTHEGDFTLYGLIEEYKNKNCCSSCISTDNANIIYTSGSTGKPKGIVLSHQNLIEGAKIVAQYLHISAEDKIAGVLPFNFDYGLNQLTTAMLKGASLILHAFILPNDLLNFLKKEKITGLAGIPPIWNTLFNAKLTAKEQYDFPHLRYLTNSGGKMPVPIVRKIKEFFPHTDIYLMYGLTEAFRSTYLDPKEIDKRPNSIGKAIPNVEIYVVNEKGEECVPYEHGELIHRGTCIAKGYWNDLNKTQQVYRLNPLLKNNKHLETVVYSGDLVYRDEEGFLYFVSRKDEMIKTQGYRVSPTEVEEVLLKFQGIQNAVVFGVENEQGEQKIRALIQTHEVLNVKDILAHCKNEIPTYMVPHEIIFYNEFPKTASGKIDRAKLKMESIIKQRG